MGRGRPSKIIHIVDGAPLRTYLLKRLVTSSYRGLLKDEQFKKKTGIKSIGNFQNQCKLLEINIETIFNFGKENGMIPFNEQFSKWSRRTRGAHYKPKINIKLKDIYKSIGKEIGIEFDEFVSEDEMLLTLYDFIDETAMKSMIARTRESLKGKV